jgi:GT2 family glycosyltransferase
MHSALLKAEVKVRQASTTPRVHVVIVNWNGEDDTCRCLTSLLAVAYPDMHVVISDNGSRPDSLAALHQWARHNRLQICEADEDPVINPTSAIKSLCIVRNGRNLGFTGANTVGIAYGMKNAAEYVMFLNNDTWVTPSFLTRMVDVAEHDRTYGVLGCKTFLGDERHADGTPIIWSLGGYEYQFGNPMNRGSNLPDRPEWKGVLDSELVCGCCMLIRRNTIEQCGVQDDRLFFAIDDVEYSLRAARAGWKNALVLDAEISHAGSKSAEGRVGLQLYYLFRNTYYFRTRYFPWYRNVIFFIHHVFRYVLIGSLGRTLLGRGSANKGMWLGLYDYFADRMGECPYPSLLRRRGIGD